MTALSQETMPLWYPGMMTEPLAVDFETDGDRLIALAERVFTFEESDKFTLEEWQKWLIRRVLEKYPASHPDPNKRGRLRYRQVVISLGRQNGKSVLGAVFALYGLLLQVPRSPRVISLASTVEQANIVFNKVRYAVESSPMLDKRFKATRHRGVNSRDNKRPASYVVKAGNGKGLQGAAVNMCLFDEIHISREDAWDAMVLGTSAQQNAMILGITTAGDNNSELLKRLYKTGTAAVNREDGFDEQFGFFKWEAPAHLDMYDPQAFIAANPAIANGRIPVQQEIQAAKNMPAHEVERYRLNRFVSSENVWMPISKWLKVGGKGIQSLPPEKRKNVVLFVDRTLSWENASLVAAVKVDGIVYTEVIATFNEPSVEWLEKVIVEFHNVHRTAGIYMDSAVLKELSTRLKDRGLPVEYCTQAQMMNAAATAYSLIATSKVVHANDPILGRQMPKAVTENVGEGHKVSRRKSEGQVDAVIATVGAIWAAENIKPKGELFYIHTA